MDNPIDFAGAVEGEPALLPQVLEILASAGLTAPVCLAGHFGGYHWLAGEAILPDEVEACRRVAELARTAPFPLFAYSIYADAPLPTVAALREGGAPVSRSMRALALALDALRREPGAAVEETVAPPKDETVALLRRRVQSSGVRWLLEPDGRKLLAQFGILAPAAEIISSPKAAVAAWRCFGGPVVLKAISRTLLHKSDRGGVLVGLDEAPAVEVGTARLLALCRDLGDADGRVLVTPQIGDGVELIVGAFRDVHYGPTLMVGAGGMLAEMTDVVWGFPPLSSAEIEVMLGRLRIAPLLDRARTAAVRPPGAGASAWPGRAHHAGVARDRGDRPQPRIRAE